MPANLTPQYKAAEQRFRNSTTDQDKLDALNEMLQIIPKHKGTEKLQAEIKSRIAKIKKGGEKKGGGTKQKALDNISREGAAQIPLVGAPNCGKSQFLATNSNANTDVADYPFTTRTPIPGMMPWKDIKFQLIDLPPISEESFEGWMISILFRADSVFLFADLSSDDLLEDLDMVLSLLEERKITLAAPGFEIEEDAHSLDSVCKPTYLLANKYDCDEDDIRFDFLAEKFQDRFPILKINSLTNEGVDELILNLYNDLNLIRVYTKQPGHDADMSDPVILTKPTTVKDAAFQIHKDFAKKLNYAKIWGNDRFDGQRVQADYELEDGDILEFHI